MALQNTNMPRVERPQTPFFSLKQIDSPIAIKARLVHAREKASGGTPMILPGNRVPMTANRKLNAEKPISALLIYSIAYLLLYKDLVWYEIVLFSFINFSQSTITKWAVSNERQSGGHPGKEQGGQEGRV